MQNRRKGSRIPSLLRAYAVFNDRRFSRTCMIQDTSSGGARLEFEANEVIPDTFELCIPDRGGFCPVETRWRSANAVGVSFRDERGLRLMPGAVASARLEMLEAEVGQLRQHLVELYNALDLMRLRMG